MVTNLPEREVAICRRLRQFREARRIPRSKFAVALGIGGERLATYESARVPLRYEVYAAIHKLFFISPLWLATGQGDDALNWALQDSSNLPPANPRALFSEVYDNRLADQVKHEAIRAAQFIENMSQLSDFINSGEGMAYFRENKEAAKLVSERFNSIVKSWDDALSFQQKVIARVRGKKQKGS